MTKAEEVKKEIEAYVENASYYRTLQFLWEEHGQVKEEQVETDSGRWLAYVTTYWTFDDGSALAFDWGSGLTENQENEGPYKIYLVQPYEETIVVTKYREVEND